MDTEKAIALKLSYGKLVLVTGASSGIGKSLCEQFAQAGFDLVVAARSEDKLLELKEQLQNTYRISVTVIAGDHSKPDDLERFKSACVDLPIGIAIINAGYGNTGAFLNTSLEAEINMVDLNVRSVLSLSHFFAKKFSRQKKSALVLLSSMVSFQGVPYMANYGATKAYVQSLAEALYYELKPKGIDVLSVAPGPVDTGFSDRARITMTNMADAGTVAANIIAAIGSKQTVYPALNARLMRLGLGLLPRSIKVKMMNIAMKAYASA